MTNQSPTPNQEAILAESEKPATDGRWVYAADIDTEKGVVKGHIVVAVPHDFVVRPGQTVPAYKATCVAHFHRVSDARRVVAAMKALEGIDTDALEAMPDPVIDALRRMLELKGLLDVIVLAAKNEESWTAMRQGILAEQNAQKPTAH